MQTLMQYKTLRPNSLGVLCLREVITLRVPTDMSLPKYIRALMGKGQVWKFYKTEEWQALRAEVLRDHHHECAECLKSGRYTRADCVHHVNEVRHRPDLALSRYYIDGEGQKQANLVPLCNQCHNMVHDKLGDWQKRYKYTNEERW